MKKRPNTMKLAGSLVLVMLTVGATAQAQCPLCGSFTLPFEVEWGGDVLPVGHYTFEVQSAMHLVRGYPKCGAPSRRPADWPSHQDVGSTSPQQRARNRHRGCQALRSHSRHLSYGCVLHLQDAEITE
jgi:hypothetical protein